jgi:hypothetical protein
MIRWGRRLGRAPHDPVLLAAAPPHLMGAAKPPATLDRRAIFWTPTLVRNDVLPTCTIAALLNSARAYALVHGFDIPTDEAKALMFYARLAGCLVADIASTDGLDMLAVVQAARDRGFDAGGQTPLAPTFAAITPIDRDAMADAMATRGAVNLGVLLSVSDQTMDVWDTITPTDAGDAAPGSWGGHDLAGIDYSGLGDDDLVRLATWGGFHLATWRWIRLRTELAVSHVWGALAGAAP